MPSLFSNLARPLGKKPRKRQPSNEDDGGGDGDLVLPVTFRLNDLLPELILYIACFLPLQSAYALACTSRSHYEICRVVLPRLLVLTPANRLAICSKLALRDEQSEEQDALPVDKLALATSLVIKSHGEASWDSDDMASTIGEVLQGLPLLKEIQKLGGGFVGSSALNALCGLVGNKLESLTATWVLDPDRPLDPVLLPFARLSTLELTCIAWTYPAAPIPTELSQAFPLLQHLTLRCTPRYLHVDDFLATCTFPFLSHFALLCILTSHDPCSWSDGALAALSGFLTRHCATLTSLTMPPWDVDGVTTPHGMLRAVNTALAHSRVYTLRVNLMFASAVAWSDIPLLYLRELRVDEVGKVDKEFVHDRNRAFVWPTAPNLRVLVVVLVDMEKIDLKTIPAAYPLLEELHLDLRDAYISHDIDKAFVNLFLHLRWISVRLSRPRGKKGVVERIGVRRDGRRLVKLVKEKILENAFILD